MSTRPLDGQHFVWDHDKAAENILRHRISFDTAREAFLDPDCVYEDASPQWEARQACIGQDRIYRVLYVVHVEREHDVLRLISARPADAAERIRYEDV